ncbi:Protocadherin Fat 4, partial [Stylophora pistillata]
KKDFNPLFFPTRFPPHLVCHLIPASLVGNVFRTGGTTPVYARLVEEDLTVNIFFTKAAVMAAITTLFVSLASAHVEKDTWVTDIYADQKPLTVIQTLVRMVALVGRMILLIHLSRTGGVNVPRDTAEGYAVKCYNGGKCEVQDKQPKCNCEEPYQGESCLLDNSCLPKNGEKRDPCNNGGKCEFTDGKVTCVCPTRYEGPTCALDKCAKCDKNAYCENGVCKCRPPYEGDGITCTKPEEEKPNKAPTNPSELPNSCTPNKCKNGAECIEGKSTFYCVCPKDTYGRLCEKITPTTQEEPQGNECKDCHYNAKCINRECVCKAGYTGDGFDCRPYKITHRPCPIQCATECHARCPQSCCKHHRVLKIHYNDANPQQMNVPPNELPHKNASSPNPTAVLLRPESKLNEHLANFAPDFEQRPDDPEAANLEAISLKNPTGGFSVSEMEGRPLLQKEECPGECKTECRDSCPVRCCLGKCPLSWMESCHPSCPKTCCYSPGTNHIFPMLDPKVQENFMTTMIEKFCPKACKAKCNSNCPPICCERNSSDSGGIRSANVHQLKTEGKHGADSFRNAMSWFGMMNFVNMMYNMYGNLYGANHFNKIPFTPTDRKLKPIKPTKPQTTSILNPSKVNEVGVPESAAVSVLTCPNYCNKSCRQDCPPRCCESKSESKSLNAIGVPLKCPSSCKLYCSKSCPSSCCSKSSPPTPSGQHPTGGINVAKSLSISPSPHSPEPAPPPAPAPAPSLPRPPAACTPICPAYWYPQCLENCCQRGEVANKKSSKQLRAKNQGKQSYDTFFAKEPNGPSQDCPAVCRRSCGPSCPLRCCDRPISSPTATQPAAPSPSMNTPLCPGYCASQCFPACTISCCKAGFIKSNSNLNMPALSPSRREHRPPTITESFPLPPPAAVCHPGCSRSCYPNCDESCCRASAQVFRVPNSKPVGDSSHLTIKVPCPSECRPFNCLYYCHHDCCLPRSETRNLKRRGYKDLRRKFGVMRRAKTPILKPIFKAFGKRIAKKRTKIPSRSSQRNLPNKVH